MASTFALARLLVSARRYRGLLVGLLLVLLVTAGLLAVALGMRARAETALRADTQTTALLLTQQFQQTVASRRAIIALVRDSLDKTPNLSPQQMLAISAAAARQMPDLVGIGILRHQEERVIWWHGPERFNSAATASLNRQLIKAWRAQPSLRAASIRTIRPTHARQLLILTEPLRKTAEIPRAIVGAFDLRRLLNDFFALNLHEAYQVQLFDGLQLLYASSDQRRAPPGQAWAGHAIAVGDRTWQLVLWPANDQTIRILNVLRVCLFGLSATAAVGIFGIIWLLVTRAQVLAREVDKRTETLRELAKKLHTQATTDELTGAYNRRFILEHLNQECERSKRYGRPLSCLMIDINGFKQVNDTFGHHVGDMILKQVVQELRERLRESDVLARLGGDEFVVALPETDRTHARRVAQKLSTLPIQAAVPAHRLGTPSVSLSVGVGTLKPGQTPETLLAEADKELYEAKRARITEARGVPAAPAHPVR